VSINIFKIDENVSLNKVINDLNIQNPHYVVPAWISSNSSLVSVLISEFAWPEYKGVPEGVGGLSGRVYYEPDKSSLSEKQWLSLWKLCDQVNDAYETGTLLPKYPVTLLPAYTVTNPFVLEKAELSIKDAIKAHQSYAEGDLVFVFCWGVEMKNKIEEWLYSFLLHLEIDLDCFVIFPFEKDFIK